MSDAEALASFTGKWRERWPEWQVAEVFVPASQRESALAWFALRQELTDAAWGGSDPRPGEAKLGWWAEELRGWTQGRRRHPLGLVLQKLPVRWDLLATALPALLASREPPSDGAGAMATLQPFAEAVAHLAAGLFGGDAPPPPDGVATSLLAEQLLGQGEAAVPLQVRARRGVSPARAWAAELLDQWAYPPQDTRPGRIQAALLQARLRRYVATGEMQPGSSRWRVLWQAWRAARG
jgi:hypothetical protein